MLFIPIVILIPIILAYYMALIPGWLAAIGVGFALVLLMIFLYAVKLIRENQQRKS